MNGHGTHVAATIGGTKYGVAKKATIIGVKVLGDDGSGSTSSIISGLQWAADHAEGAGVINQSVSPLYLVSHGSYANGIGRKHFTRGPKVSSNERRRRSHRQHGHDRLCGCRKRECAYAFPLLTLPPPPPP